MEIQVKDTLTRSRNPTEYKIRLENKIGNIVHVLPDGYNLIKFKEFNFRVKHKEGKKTVWRYEPLQWYIHETDFYLTGK